MRRRRLLAPAAALLLAGIFSGLAAPDARAEEYRCHADGITDRYDPFFKIAARRWMPKELGEDAWCVMKSNCFNESGLDENAVSPAGAVSLCQLMRATFADLQKRHGFRGEIRDVRANVKAGALLFNQFWHVWVTTPRTTDCRTELTIASTNAGPKWIIEAQTLAGGALCWEKIRTKLHEVTGHHATETINHVTRFWRTFRRLRGWTLGG